MSLEKVSGTLDLDWIAPTEAERGARQGAGLVAKHAMLFAVGLRFRRMRSSMLSAIERGRTPAVDFLNGEIVERARLHGLASPANARVRDEVWRLARRGIAPSLGHLRSIAHALRA